MDWINTGVCLFVCLSSRDDQTVWCKATKICMHTYLSHGKVLMKNVFIFSGESYAIIERGFSNNLIIIQ